MTAPPSSVGRAADTDAAAGSWRAASNSRRSSSHDPYRSAGSLAMARVTTASTAAGLPIPQCEVYRLHLGGGFGRRSSSHDYVRQAVLIAKQMPGTPVKLIWSREEDMLHGRYHPVTQCKLTGALDADGNLDGLHMRISGQSILANINPQGLQNGKDPATFQGLNPSGTEGVLGYTVPNLLIDHAMRNPPVPPGFWRGVNNNQNAIYLECFVDELAHAAGKDPLEFRRALMANHPKHLAVLNAVAERAGCTRTHARSLGNRHAPLRAARVDTAAAAGDQYAPWLGPLARLRRCAPSSRSCSSPAAARCSTR